MDLAVPADYRVKMKESKRNEQILWFFQKAKKKKRKTVADEGNGETNCWGPKRSRKIWTI